MSEPAAPVPALTHRQIMTVLAGLMLAALSQTELRLRSATDQPQRVAEDVAVATARAVGPARPSLRSRG